MHQKICNSNPFTYWFWRYIKIMAVVVILVFLVREVAAIIN